MAYYPSCEGLIPDHTCNPCEQPEFGRIRTAGFIHKDFIFLNGDTTSQSEWDRGIKERMILVIPYTNGELPLPSEVLIPGYGDTSEQLTGYDFTATFNDPNYKENCDFYNAMVGKNYFKLFYRTSSQTHITQVPVTVIPKTQVQNDLNSVVEWNVTAKWKHNQFPCPFNSPEFTCVIPD